MTYCPLPIAYYFLCISYCICVSATVNYLMVGSGLMLCALMFAAGMTEDWQQILCFPFGLLNGVMSATTGFARTGHFTGVLTNVGLLIGQVTNEVNNTPEIWWNNCYYTKSSRYYIRIQYSLWDINSDRVCTDKYTKWWLYMVEQVIQFLRTNPPPLVVRAHFDLANHTP